MSWPYRTTFGPSTMTSEARKVGVELNFRPVKGPTEAANLTALFAGKITNEGTAERLVLGLEFSCTPTVQTPNTIHPYRANPI